MTWDDLFERAGAYETTEDDVRATLAAVRGSDDGNSDGDDDGDGNSDDDGDDDGDGNSDDDGDAYGHRDGTRSDGDE